MSVHICEVLTVLYSPSPHGSFVVHTFSSRRLSMRCSHSACICYVQMNSALALYASHASHVDVRCLCHAYGCQPL